MTAAQIRSGAKKLGFEFGKKLTKGKLVKALEELRISAKRIANAVGWSPSQKTKQARSEGSKSGDQRRGNQWHNGKTASNGEQWSETGDRNGNKGQDKTPRRFDDFRADQLHRVLNDLGVHGTGDWNKAGCIKLLKKLGMTVNRMRKMLKASGTGPSEVKKKKGRSKRWEERPPWDSFVQKEMEEDMEWLREELGDDADVIFEFDTPWSSKRRRGRRRNRNADYVGYAEYEQMLDDFGDATMFGNDWSDRQHWKYARDEFRGSGPRHQGSHRRSHGAQAAPASTPTADASEVMARALKQKWSPDSLSLSQARDILGLPARHSDEEFRSARKQQMFLWHPDRNPDHADADSAFRLVMAAAVKLRG